MATQDFNPTVGPDRVSLEDRDHEYVEDIEKQGTLFVDARRARSFYTDGRFLAARDLIREQNYVLTRQADLSRAGGAGVIRGLEVAAFGNRALRVFAGHGVTFAGELVALDQTVIVNLEDVSELQQLDASFGLAPIPTAAPEARTGLYVLVLRPIEYVTREIVKYPTTVDGKRSKEPGDIVEGVALTLIPYRDDRQERDLWKQRSHVARSLFFDRAARGIPAETLPLAMLSIERGFIRWLDVPLVRREIGAEHAGVVGFGVSPRALREAHLIQYDRQLRELMVQRQAAGKLRFAASEYFEVLPPAGRMPAAAIDAKDFTQHWFPAQMTVDLTIVTDDEVTMLIEESLLLPPIDVSGEAEDLDFTTMQILIPMSRESLRRLRLETAPRPRRLIPPLLARRKPIDVLNTLTRKGFIGNTIVEVNPKAAVDAAWREALAAVSDQLLWFVRRRTLELRVPELFPQPRLLLDRIEAPSEELPPTQPATETAPTETGTTETGTTETGTTGTGTTGTESDTPDEKIRITEKADLRLELGKVELRLEVKDRIAEVKTDTLEKLEAAETDLGIRESFDPTVDPARDFRITDPLQPEILVAQPSVDAVRPSEPAIAVVPTGEPAIAVAPTGEPAIAVAPTGEPAIAVPTSEPAIEVARTSEPVVEVSGDRAALLGAIAASSEPTTVTSAPSAEALAVELEGSRVFIQPEERAFSTSGSVFTGAGVDGLVTPEGGIP